MRGLGVATDELCNGMAHALAVLHWHAKIDGKNVEFVLGRSPIEEQQIRADVSHLQKPAKKPQSTYETATYARGDLRQPLLSL